MTGSGEEELAAKLAEAEDRLRVVAERYALATAAAEVGVWDWNLGTGEFHLDANLKALLGYEDHEIANDLAAWSDYVHPEDREAVMRAAQGAIDGVTPEYVFEHRMRHKDGSVRWFMVRGRVIRAADGRAVRFVGTDTDITARVRLEQELRDSSSAVQTQIGHDLHDSLGQELTALALKLAGLEARYATAPELAGELRDVRGLAEHAIATTEALARGLSPVLGAAGLASGLELLAATARRLYGIECEVSLPSEAGESFNATQANELYRIAQEAVTNAVRHGKATRVTLEGRVLGTRFLLNVADNGVGIAESGAPLESDGTSMGLRIMQYRARNLGGSVTVSRLRHGGTLVVCACPLPRARSSSA